MTLPMFVTDLCQIYCDYTTGGVCFQLVGWLSIFQRVFMSVFGKFLICLANFGVISWSLMASAFGEIRPGELLWEFDPGFAKTNQDFFTEPEIGQDGMIYVGHVPSVSASSGVFYAINPDGTERWKKTFAFPSYERFGGGRSSSFQAATIGLDGTVFLACGGSHYAYSGP
jgi:hypothetical protein